MSHEDTMPQSWCQSLGAYRNCGLYVTLAFFES
jgi:hypothetical protein